MDVARKMASEIPKMFDAFGHNSNTFMSVVIWFSIFRRKLLQLECSKSVSNLEPSRFISLSR